jgi:hypothetical protein
MKITGFQFCFLLSSVTYSILEECASYLLGCNATCSLLVHLLTHRPWRWRQDVPPNRRWTSAGLHSVTSQKMPLFIVTAVRTSNRTFSVYVLLTVGRDFHLASRDMMMAGKEVLYLIWQSDQSMDFYTFLLSKGKNGECNRPSRTLSASEHYVVA